MSYLPLRQNLGAVPSDNDFFKYNATTKKYELVQLTGTTVSPQTANYTVLSGESGYIFTNEGNTTGLAFTLPTPSTGLSYQFFNQAAQSLVLSVANSGTETIINEGTAYTTIENLTLGGACELIAINSTQWALVDKIGTWATPVFFAVFQNSDAIVFQNGDNLLFN